LGRQGVDSTLKPALALMLGRGLGFAISFGIPVVMARIFDPAEFGTYKQIFLMYATLYGVAQFGMAESLYYFLPLAPGQGGRYVLNAMAVLAVGGLASLGLLWTFGPNVSHWFHNPQLPDHLTLIGLYLLLTLISAVLEIVMICQKRHRWASVSYALSELLRAPLFIVPVLVIRRLEWLLLGAAGFAVLRLGAALAYVWREFGGQLRPDTALLRRQLAYAIPFEMAVVVEILQAQFHQYAVSYHFDAAVYAIYAVGCLQIPVAELVGTSAANVMMVRMSEDLRDGRRDAVLALWQDTTRKLALVFFPLVGLLIVVARELIVFLFTERYVASVPIFMVWSTVMLFAALQTDAVMRVYAQTRFLLACNAIRLAVIALFIHWLLSVFHLPGAVLVTILATAVAKGMALARMKSLMGAGLSDLLPWRSLAAILAVAAAAAVPALIVKSELGASVFPRLVIASFVYAASYVALLYRFRLLSEGERLAVAGWMHAPAADSVKAGRLANN
jgi:O-antigen/teichoic acid export membrane protein